ncbi:MAG: hypothetical protein RIS66_1066 [Actinomycetota bacterium]
MAGFLFWKKKRGAEVEAPEFETPVVIETNESLVADAAEAAYVAAESIPSQIELESTPEPEPQPETTPEPEPTPEPELVAVELPKRSAKKGIRSLFSRVKFNPENLDELEDILIQALSGNSRTSLLRSLPRI